MKTKNASKKNAPKFDMIGQIIAFEGGELDESGVIELFQYLISSGTIYHLQGSYGRTAQSLINAGLI